MKSAPKSLEYQKNLSKNVLSSRLEWLKKLWSDWQARFFFAILILGAIFILRAAGLLQIYELQAFDWYGQNPVESLLKIPVEEKLDDRIAIVEISETDIKNLATYPLEDKELADLLTKINRQKPLVIGLDIYRDLPVPKDNTVEYNRLQKIFAETDNLVGIEKVVGTHSPGIEPIRANSTLLRAGRVGANDQILDLDGFIRRTFLAITPANHFSEQLAGTQPNFIESFAIKIAAFYFNEHNLNVSQEPTNELRLGNTVLPQFLANDGGYVRADDSSYQVFINWRIPPKKWTKLSVVDVLKNNVPPDSFKDKIVLIGNTAPSSNDMFNVPYYRESFAAPSSVYGVEVQANIIKHLIDVAEGNRTVIKTIPNLWEWFWIVFWLCLSYRFIWAAGNTKQSKILFEEQTKPSSLLRADRFKSARFLFTAIAIVTILSLLLFIFTYGAYVFNKFWLPVIPPALAIVSTGVFTNIAVYIDKIERANQHLNFKVRERTQEIEYQKNLLNAKNASLNNTIKKLQDREEQLIAQDRLVNVGKLAENLCHELNNSLNIFISHSFMIEAELKEIKQQLETTITEQLLLIQKLEKEELPPELKAEIKLLSARINEVESESTEIMTELFEGCLPTIKKHAKLMSSIFKNMVFHGFGGKNPHNSELLNINQTITEAINTRTILLNKEDKNLGDFIKFNPDSQIEPFYLNSIDLKQVILNLINNAIDAIGTQEKKLGTDYKPLILISTLNCRDRVEIRVKDNGIGIPPSNLPLIFDRFFSQKEQFSTGLGLAIVQDIVEKKNKGSISVKSKQSAWTEFTISWPKIVKKLS